MIIDICNNRFSADIQTLKLHIEEENSTLLTGIDKKQSKDFIKPNSIFCNNKLQAQNITESIDFKQKEVDENVAEVKENAESTVGKRNSSYSLNLLN